MFGTKFNTFLDSNEKDIKMCLGVIIEEMMDRFLLFNICLWAMSRWHANLLSSLWFGITHGLPVGRMIWSTLVSFYVLVPIYEKYGLLGSTITHWTINVLISALRSKMELAEKSITGN